MKKLIIAGALVFIFSGFFFQFSAAQCSVCTRTAQQLGEKPAKGLNAGIVYLATTPFLIAGYVFYRWRKSNHTD